MRFERKYRISHLTMPEVRQVIMMHPASFRLHYADRYIHNIYFDTPDLYTLLHNAYGSPRREKYRLRWYGDNIYQISKPRFEIKKKQGEAGFKEIHEMEDGRLSEITLYLEPIKRLQLPLAYALMPVLLNSYERSYYISFDGKFRLTIDRAVKYHGWNNGAKFQSFTHRDNAVIVELKYELEQEKDIERIIRYLPFRQTKNSKYVQGLQLCSFN